MPAHYVAMRDAFKHEGLSDVLAKRKAARIYNAGRKRGQAPVTRRAEGGKVGRR